MNHAEHVARHLAKQASPTRLPLLMVLLDTVEGSYRIAVPSIVIPGLKGQEDAIAEIVKVELYALTGGSEKMDS